MVRHERKLGLAARPRATRGRGGGLRVFFSLSRTDGGTANGDPNGEATRFNRAKKQWRRVTITTCYL